MVANCFETPLVAMSSALLFKASASVPRPVDQYKLWSGAEQKSPLFHHTLVSSANMHSL